MRQKKRYVRLKEFRSDEELVFLFQDQDGYVFKTSPRSAQKLRASALLISGSIKKLKRSATQKG